MIVFPQINFSSFILCSTAFITLRPYRLTRLSLLWCSCGLTHPCAVVDGSSRCGISFLFSHGLYLSLSIILLQAHKQLKLLVPICASSVKKNGSRAYKVLHQPSILAHVALGIFAHFA
jgi:hypothetical protein